MTYEAIDMKEHEQNELDFNTDDYNGFYYTNEKHLKKMDDKFILSKVIEKYPDFSKSDDENILKQTLSVIASDTKFIKRIISELGITVEELFSSIYRKYSFIFNGSFISKIQKIISGRAYAREVKRRVGKGKTSGRGKSRKRRGAKRTSRKNV